MFMQVAFSNCINLHNIVKVNILLFTAYVVNGYIQLYSIYYNKIFISVCIDVRKAKKLKQLNIILLFLKNSVSIYIQ